MKKVGIIGSGEVGKTLAKGFLAIGYDVMLGSRDISKVNDVEGAKAGSVEDAAAFAPLLVLAVKGSAALKAIANCNVDGKIIIDTCNPFTDKPPINGILEFSTQQNDSIGEQLQKANPNAQIVKCFNSVGSGLMVNPDFGGTKPTMFICGNDEEAKSTIKEILDAFGWETEDMGVIEASRAIESLCMLWCIPGFLRNEWNHAFKLLKK